MKKPNRFILQYDIQSKLLRDFYCTPEKTGTLLQRRLQPSDNCY